MVNFFAYGTLQIPEVMLALTGRSFAFQTAFLANFARRRLQGKSFPGILPKPGSVVCGLVYWDIGREALGCLDAFEDDFYHRQTVGIATANGIASAAEVYVINEESHGMLLEEEWCLEDFRRKQLRSFLLCHE